MKDGIFIHRKVTLLGWGGRYCFSLGAHLMGQV